MLPRAQVALIVLWVLVGLAWGFTEPAPISRLFGQAFVFFFPDLPHLCDPGPRVALAAAEEQMEPLDFVCRSNVPDAGCEQPGPGSRFGRFHPAALRFELLRVHFKVGFSQRFRHSILTPDRRQFDPLDHELVSH
jgi:hypothetical protein